ncbi:hypothetical protein IAD21_02412 [Abditibacteriota bacterium]|nr:hypothetical protein IAD21_02412 [Abditibacteriota bacterium]
MKPPTGPQNPQSPSPAPQAPAPPPPQKAPSQPGTSPSPQGTIPPRGEDFDISTLPASSGATDKKRLPPGWNLAWIGAAVVLAAYCLWFFAYGMGAHSQKPMPLGPIKTNGSAPVPTTITVHVAGAVARPGVYSLNAGARITDAINQAGGPTPDAETTTLNLADFAKDGAQIIVPVRAAPVSNAVPATGAAPAVPSSSLGVAPAAPNTLPAPTATISPANAQRAAQTEYLRAHPIDLNQATSFELQQLPGIGPAITVQTVMLFFRHPIRAL